MKIYKYILVFAFLGCLGGCTQFLDLPAKNERSVQSLDDVKSVLSGYLCGQATPGYRSIIGLSPLFSSDMVVMFEAYSDNIDFNQAVPDYYLVDMNQHMQERQYANVCLWNDFDTPKSVWMNYYEVIGFLNALIDQMDEVSFDSQEEWNRVMGELVTHRAYYLFKLLQYFAPYQDAKLGIPVYLHTGEEVVGISMLRKTQAEVYSIILSDLNRANELLAVTEPEESFNLFFRKLRVNHILAQVYWFKAESGVKEDTDYENAAKYAKNAIEGTETLIPKTTAEFMSVAANANSSYPGLYMRGNTYAATAGIYGSTWDYIGYEPSNVPVEQDFYLLFSEDDIRHDAYFSAPATIASSWPDGKSYGQKNGNCVLFKPEEAYLILAEALYHTGGDAAGVLNTFKSFRNAGNAAGLRGESLLMEIMNERRKEFFADTDKRWLDLKKYGGTIRRHLVFFEKAY
ncbi:MAG: RagB/SusD family nutrient uptake outer membrane protein, partial [Odoribacter sp.]|nr:RagB/SusD family nutrient uptake outer membrane protein [Odoribacter sp.]